MAKKLNADEYGKKNYVFVLLKPGSTTSVNKTTEDYLFHGHMKNTTCLAGNRSDGFAGLRSKNDLYRGLFVLNIPV